MFAQSPGRSCYRCCPLLVCLVVGWLVGRLVGIVFALFCLFGLCRVMVLWCGVVFFSFVALTCVGFWVLVGLGRCS